MQDGPGRPRRARRALLGVGATLLTVIVLGFAFVAATSSYSSVPFGVERSTGPRAAPAWSRPCWRRDLRYRKRWVVRCGRVDGRVLYVQRRDPDGDGDEHLVVLADANVVIVKLPRRAGVRDLPAVGGR